MYVLTTSNRSLILGNAEVLAFGSQDRHSREEPSVARIPYVRKNFRTDARQVIAKANEICEEYAAQGFDLTLRQLYYQFVARDLIPNRQSEYKRLGSIVNDARLAGVMDWNFIVDRTRNLSANSHWKTPADIIKGASDWFGIDKWSTQECQVEVWVEKDALVGVLESVCPTLDVAYFSCRGYTSISEIWVAANRLRRYLANGKRVILLHLGDHDPSGLDMTRDIEKRLQLLIGTDLIRYDGFERSEAVMTLTRNFEVNRVALNHDQILTYDPPPNPAKTTDARWQQYVARTGLTDSWELDALDPAVLVGLVEDAVTSYRDEGAWNRAVARENEAKALLKQVSDRWEDVQAFLGA